MSDVDPQASAGPTGTGKDRRPKGGVTSPKRSRSERQGLHAWHPYYAGFSEAFVADMLSELEVRPGHLVFDPMNGSGTTTLVAQQLGLLAVGNELNPAMAIMARAKDAAFAGRDKAVDTAARVAELARKRQYDGRPDDHTHSWIPPQAFANLKRLDSEITALDEPPVVPLDGQLSAMFSDQVDLAGGREKDLLRAALLLTARRASTAEDSKNPTWLKPGNGTPPDQIDVFDEFHRVVSSMLSDIADTFEVAIEARRLVVCEADARELPLPDRSIDAIVTSPPYLTRIDYAVGTAPELVVLGYESEDELRALRREIMGSTCVTGGPYEMRRCWGSTCLDTVDRVRRHASKASSGYYLKMHVQYFRDAEAFLRECLRVLKPGAAAAIVVQDSWYKDIHVALDAIYAEMAMELGAASATTIHSEAVRTHLGLVNTRARRYSKGPLHEHVVLVRKR